MFKKIYKKYDYKVYLLVTKKSCYHLMLMSELGVVAIYYVSKEDGSIFSFYPVEYTYESTDYYNDIIRPAIKVLLEKGE